MSGLSSEGWVDVLDAKLGQGLVEVWARTRMASSVIAASVLGSAGNSTA
jgi:hypothetical protein